MAATSGWVGFFAAAVGAYFVYHQLAEQRKQTAFALGDGLPTFEIVRRSREHFSAVFRVTNWNRRTLVIDGLRIKSSASFTHPIGIRRMAGKEPAETPASDYILTSADGAVAHTRASGWLDRQKAPWTVSFLLLFEGRQLGPLQDIPINIPATIELDVFFTGEPDKVFTLEVGGKLSDFLPCDVPRGGYFELPEKRQRKT